MVGDRWPRPWWPLRVIWSVCGGLLFVCGLVWIFKIDMVSGVVIAATGLALLVVGL